MTVNSPTIIYVDYTMRPSVPQTLSRAVADNEDGVLHMQSSPPSPRGFIDKT